MLWSCISTNPTGLYFTLSVKSTSGDRKSEGGCVSVPSSLVTGGVVIATSTSFHADNQRSWNQGQKLMAALG